MNESFLSIFVDYVIDEFMQDFEFFTVSCQFVKGVVFCSGDEVVTCHAGKGVIVFGTELMKMKSFVNYDE